MQQNLENIKPTVAGIVARLQAIQEANGRVSRAWKLGTNIGDIGNNRLRLQGHHLAAKIGVSLLKMQV